MEIPGNFLKLIDNYLTNCAKRIPFNGQLSGWATILAAVPQDLIIGQSLSNDYKLFT